MFPINQFLNFIIMSTTTTTTFSKSMNNFLSNRKVYQGGWQEDIENKNIPFPTERYIAGEVTESTNFSGKSIILFLKNPTPEGDREYLNLTPRSVLEVGDTVDLETIKMTRLTRGNRECWKADAKAAIQ